MPHRQRMRDTPGHYASFPWGMVAHPWPGLGFSKKCRNVTKVPLSYAWLDLNLS